MDLLKNLCCCFKLFLFGGLVIVVRTIYNNK